MKKFDLNLCFKGARKYIHGTDMLQQSTDLLLDYAQGEFGELNFIVHRMTDKNLSLIIYSPDETPDHSEHDIAVIKFFTRGKFLEARLAENDRSPDCRNPYDEDALVRLCSISRSAKNIQLQHNSPLSTIETVVAMTKALHLDVFHDLDSGWLFCRWESPRWPLGENLKDISIRLIQTLGTRLTKSEISINGLVQGYIYFSASMKQ